MQKVRLIVQQNDHKRGTKEFRSLRELWFDDICAVGMFTTDSSFCSQYQNDLRNHQSGCKWKIMENTFNNALSHLNFVQKMGKFSMKTNLKSLVSVKFMTF